MQKWLMFVLFVGAATFGLIALANSYVPDESDEEAAADPNSLRIVAKNFEFDSQEYHVKAGTKMTVKLVNKLGTHGVEFKGLDIKLSPNDGLEKEVTFDKPGTYDMDCIVMCGTGHAQMVSKLIVE